MKKFTTAFNEKKQQYEEIVESQILSDFKTVYYAMLENYNIKSLNELDEETQVSFLTELNNYWSEEEGMSEKGEKFLEKRSFVLNENSTVPQKKNFLKAKITAVVNESLRQTDLRWRIYECIDEAYNQLEAKDLKDVLSPASITEIVNGALTEAFTKLSKRIETELNESAKPEAKYVIKKKA